MKMKKLLWRKVSVWLCVAVLFTYLSCYVESTEPQPEAQSSVSSQDIGTKEESVDKNPNEKITNEGNWGLPEPDSSEDYHHNGKQLTQEVEYAEPLESDQPPAETEPKEEGISLSERSSEHKQPETSGSQEQESEPPPLSTVSLAVISSPYKDDFSISNVQEDISNRDGSEAAAPGVTGFDELPSDCAEEEEEEEENNLFDEESSPPIVLENTSNAHLTGTNTKVVPALSSPAVHSSKHLEANASHVLKEQDPSSLVSADTDSTVSSKDPEDIPTFDEWKRKMMEVEKEKTLSTHTSNNGGSHTAKKVQKNFNNYASVECGAKLLGSNPEAKSTSAILKENMDLYMLNPCSAIIWFIIELCEPIQLKQLDIANFELFSSTPKDFLVSISDRYPTNKWLKLGTFHARDERTVQSFPLDEHLYAKYVKMFTKYIKLHAGCLQKMLTKLVLRKEMDSSDKPSVSLLMVFGTSMVEEYEEIADPSERADDQDDDLDHPPGSLPGEDESKNLIGSAKDAIFNMVKDIADVLGGNQDMTGNLSSHDVNITEQSQLKTPTEASTTDLSSVPDGEDVQSLTDPVVPPTETAATLPSNTDDREEKLPPKEEKIVIQLEKDEEEPITPTIILLDKEEDLEDAKEKEDNHRWHQGDLKPCASCSSYCSCGTSFQEFILQQCSASQTKKMTCRRVNEVPKVPSIQTGSSLLAPALFPEPHPEADQSNEKEPASEPQADRGTTDAEAELPSQETVSGSNVLEPSQIPNFPTPTPTESSSAKPTAVVETAKLLPEEPTDGSDKESGKSKDVLTEEKMVEPSFSPSSPVEVKPSVGITADEASTATTDEKPNIDSSQVQANASAQTQDKVDEAPVHSSTSTDNKVEVPAGVESLPTLSEANPTAAEAITEPGPTGDPVADTKSEDLTEDFSFSSGGQDRMFRPSISTNASPMSMSLSDIYAEPFNGTEQNGNQVHGSSQKESVFMRLNNRIKALEVNMSLSGRYLEQLSQRYRKQMEEMQRAFNKTIIKLQNTSRIAEEQDLRQTESILQLQGQLENVTQLVLNLSVRVSQLQNEVSDRQSYLLLSVLLCLCLGLLLCINHLRITVSSGSDPEPPNTKGPAYCSLDRLFSSCDETGLKRSASYPLINSETVQLASTEGPEMLDAEDNHSLCPANRKRRRQKPKPSDRVETLKPCFQSAPELCNGAVVRNTTNASPLIKQLLQPPFRDSPSEGSSEGSSHSDDPSFCGIAVACSRICDGLPPVRTRAEKRALRRRRLKPSCSVVDLHRALWRDNIHPLPVTINDIMSRKTERNSGPFITIPGPV